MLYFLPTYFAIKNKKTNALVIFLINLIFGWSIIGWLIALNMAMKHHHGMKT
ncbi:superinfection immunity protein [archaeon]|nr:superinfection immunity protein [archaeon]MBT4396655.1 superinfection immunity protein [archaeon]MBT4441265.1 superinfection immunity protein [archaeon]